MRKATGVPWQRAFAEFFVIFLGITLSLVADDWRQSRQDSVREQSALQEMTEDLSADSAELASKIRRGALWDQTALWAQGHSGRTDLPQDSVTGTIQDLFYINTYQPVRSAYLGLREGGDLNLVADNELRRSIVEYYEVEQPYLLRLDEDGFEIYWAFLQSTEGLALWRVDENADSFRDPAYSPNFEFLQPWKVISENQAFIHYATLLGLHGAVVEQRFSEVLRKNVELRSTILDHLR